MAPGALGLTALPPGPMPLPIPVPAAKPPTPVFLSQLTAELTASGSVLLDANGFSYADQFSLLLKNIPLLRNFLALSDERKLGWYEDSTKGFNVFWGSEAG
jgi:hypothetical protein